MVLSDATDWPAVTCRCRHCWVLLLVMKPVARFLQLAGLAVPPLSIVAQLTKSISLGQMLMFLVAAVCSFSIGRILEGYVRQ